MSKMDSFFKEKESSELNAKVLKAAFPELALNRTLHRRRRWLTFLAPLTAALATFFVFKFVSRNETEQLISNSEQIEFIADLIEDEDAIDIIDNMSWLEELEIIEELEIEDV